MKNPLAWFAKNEPVLAGGILAGVGVFFGVRYGAHSTAALQGSLGVGSASFIGLFSRLTTPSARADVTGIANDVAAIKEQLGPLPKTGGIAGIAKWFADLAEHHGKNIVAIADAAKTDIEDLLHQKPAVTVPEPPSTEAAPVTLTPVLEPVPEAPTPVAEPEDPELTKLKALIGTP